MLKRLYIVAILVTFSLASFTVSYAAEPVAVIVHNDNAATNINNNMLKKMYVNNILKWPGGAPVILYDLSVESAARSLFSRRILGKTPSKVAQEWAHKKITNQAINPPHTVKSQRLVIRRVSKNKGAIGYVSLKNAEGNPNVRILATLK